MAESPRTEDLSTRTYSVAVTSALGRSSTFQVQQLSTGDERRVNTDPAGLQYMRATIVFMLFAVSSTIFCGLSYASEQLQPGNRYKIIGPVYLSGVYRNLNNRQLNRQMAAGYLDAVRFSGPEVAFQREIPVGTIMTIIGPAPKVWRFPFSFPNRYFVRLDPDLSSGLDVILELDRGMEGSLDGLNPKLFSRP